MEKNPNDGVRPELLNLKSESVALFDPDLFANNVLALTAGSATFSLKVKLPPRVKLPDWSPEVFPLSVWVIMWPLALILADAVMFPNTLVLPVILI